MDARRPMTHDRCFARGDDRFILSMPEAGHIDGLDALLNNAAVASWLGGPRSRDAIAEAIERESRHWEQHRFGPWVVIDAMTRAVVGRGGLRRARVRERDEVELFYAVAPSSWKRGIATALCRAAVDLGFEEAHIESIIAFTLEANRASQRVVEKLGFVREDVFEHAGMPHVLFRLQKASA